MKLKQVTYPKVVVTTDDFLDLVKYITQLMLEEDEYEVVWHDDATDGSDRHEFYFNTVLLSIDNGFTGYVGSVPWLFKDDFIEAVNEMAKIFGYVMPSQDINVNVKQHV